MSKEHFDSFDDYVKEYIYHDSGERRRISIGFCEDLDKQIQYWSDYGWHDILREMVIVLEEKMRFAKLLKENNIEFEENVGICFFREDEDTSEE